MKITRGDFFFLVGYTCVYNPFAYSISFQGPLYYLCFFLSPSLFLFWTPFSFSRVTFTLMTSLKCSKHFVLFLLVVQLISIVILQYISRRITLGLYILLPISSETNYYMVFMYSFCFDFIWWLILIASDHNVFTLAI